MSADLKASSTADILLVGGFVETPEGLALLVHQQPLRPSGDWLAVVGDLGPQPQLPEGGVASAWAGDVRRRIMKARFPVVDLIGAQGGPVLRLAAMAVPWSGYRGAGLSSPLNVLSLLERLGTQAALSVDLAFTGIGPLSEPPGPLPEGAELQRTRIFDGYTRGWAERFRGGERPQPVVRSAPVKPEALVAALGFEQETAREPFELRLSRFLWGCFGLGWVGAFAAGFGHGVFRALSLLMASGLWAVVARPLGRAANRWTGYRETKLQSLVAGRVKVRGGVKVGVGLKTRLTEIPCAAIRWQVEVVEGRQRTTVERGEQRLPFVLEETGAQVRVTASEAELVLEPIRSGKERVITEWALVAGAPVVVWGVARRAGELEIVAHLVVDERSAQRIARLPAWHAVALGGAWVLGVSGAVALLGTMLGK